jgi:hypothetical protein
MFWLHDPVFSTQSKLKSWMTRARTAVIGRYLTATNLMNVFRDFQHIFLEQVTLCAYSQGLYSMHLALICLHPLPICGAFSYNANVIQWLLDQCCPTYLVCALPAWQGDIYVWHFGHFQQPLVSELRQDLHGECTAARGLECPARRPTAESRVWCRLHSPSQTIPNKKPPLLMVSNGDGGALPGDAGAAVACSVFVPVPGKPDQANRGCLLSVTLHGWNNVWESFQVLQAIVDIKNGGSTIAIT